MQRSLQSSTPREKPMRSEDAYSRKLLHSPSPAAITHVQVYHETKPHIIVGVITERWKAFVTQSWEENGRIQTELNTGYTQTSLYFSVLKNPLCLSGKLQ